MSGTSLDGVDGVLVDFSGTQPRVLAHQALPFAPALKQELLALNTPSENELHRAALAANGLVRVYAQTVQALLTDTRTPVKDVCAIGAHGQTVRHQPGAFDGTGYTWQLNNPALLAELTGIDVVADFRSRDLAAGGQGAPLVPAFHQGVFGHPQGCVAVLNIGGISNLSVLQPDGHVMGWDCGPGNALMDHWCQTHTGQAFDRNGDWAATGQTSPVLLERLLGESYLGKKPPKSTGRDLFNPAWLQQHLDDLPDLPAQDIQATLTALTAEACIRDVQKHARNAQRLIVCGGGALNGHLMSLLAQGTTLTLCHGLLQLRPIQAGDCASLGAWVVRRGGHDWTGRRTRRGHGRGHLVRCDRGPIDGRGRWPAADPDRHRSE